VVDDPFEQTNLLPVMPLLLALLVTLHVATGRRPLMFSRNCIRTTISRLPLMMDGFLFFFGTTLSEVKIIDDDAACIKSGLLSTAKEYMDLCLCPLCL
jgi:hypothetical protein